MESPICKLTAELATGAPGKPHQSVVLIPVIKSVGEEPGGVNQSRRGAQRHSGRSRNRDRTYREVCGKVNGISVHQWDINLVTDFSPPHRRILII